MSRRVFIKQTGVLAGSLLLGNNVLANSDLKKINVGIIGYGDRGAGIRSVLLQLKDLYQIKGICDTLSFRLEKIKNNADLKSVYTCKDYKQILNDKSISAVFIATPLFEHFRIAKDALLAGKHVYLEKAMTFTAQEALELVQLSKNCSKQVLQVGHQYRSSPLYYKVKEMIDNGYLGKVTHIDCRWDRNGSWRRNVPDISLERQINWRMYKEYSGGLAAELLSHQIDFINWVFKTTPDEIFATGGIDFYKDGRETFDNLQAVLRYDKAEMVGNFGATCANKKDGYLFKIKGSKGAISLLMNEGVFYPEPETKEALETVDGVTGATKIVWNKDGGIPILQEPTKDGTWYALKEFYQNIKENRLPDSNVFTGAKTAIVVDLINQSAYTRAIKYWQKSYDLG